MDRDPALAPALAHEAEPAPDANAPAHINEVHHAEQDPLKEAQPTAETGAHAIDGAQAVRASTAAAAGGDRANTNDASAQLAPEEADRYALAFRPSWEPLAADPALIASARPRPSVGPRASSHPPAQPHDVLTAQDELLRLRGRRARTRSVALAAVSVLSFVSLVYWGISNTTTGTEQAANRALPPPQTEPLTIGTEPEHAQVDRAAPPVSEPTALSARLADPSEPAPKTQAALSPEGDEQTQPTEDAPGDQADQADTAQAAAVVDQANSTTRIQPATAADAPPAPKEPAVAPAANQQPAVVAASPIHAADLKPAAAAVVAPPSEAKLAAAPSAQPAHVVEAKLAKIEQPPTAAAENAPARVAKATTATAESTPAAVTNTKATEPATAPRPPLLVVRAVPESAQLWLDGQRMANPFETRLPLGSKHKIEARQDGYELSSQTIRLEADARLTVTLRRDTPAPAPHIKVQPLPDAARGAGFVTANPY